VVYDGRLYLLGGEDSTGPLNDVQVVAIKGPAARGHYSKLVDLAEIRIVDSLSFTDSGTNGVTNLTYALASGYPWAFGPRTTIPDAESGTVYPTGGACGRYMWASFDLDDTTSATVNDHGLNGRGDLDFTVNYTDITPTNVTATATAPNEITVTWAAVSGAECYSVYRRKGSCSDYSYTLLDFCFTGTSYADTTVSGGSTYSYKVKTRMPSECESDYSKAESCDGRLLSGSHLCRAHKRGE
jgi:hypothetical protein